MTTQITKKQKNKKTINGLNATRNDVPQERENKQTFRGVPTSNAKKAKEFTPMNFAPHKVKKKRW